MYIWLPTPFACLGQKKSSKWLTPLHPPPPPESLLIPPLPHHLCLGYNINLLLHSLVPVVSPWVSVGEWWALAWCKRRSATTCAWLGESETLCIPTCFHIQYWYLIKLRWAARQAIIWIQVAGAPLTLGAMSLLLTTCSSHYPFAPTLTLLVWAGTF